MEEDWEDAAYDAFLLKERIAKAVKKLVTRMLKGQTEEVEDQIRMQLTDEFRFWK